MLRVGGEARPALADRMTGTHDLRLMRRIGGLDKAIDASITWQKLVSSPSVASLRFRTGGLDDNAVSDGNLRQQQNTLIPFSADYSVSAAYVDVRHVDISIALPSLERLRLNLTSPLMTETAT